MKSIPLLPEVLQFVQKWAKELLAADNITITEETKIIEDLDLDQVMQTLLYTQLGIHFEVEFHEGDEAQLHQERTVRNLAELLTNAGARPKTVKAGQHEHIDG